MRCEKRPGFAVGALRPQVSELALHIPRDIPQLQYRDADSLMLGFSNTIHSNDLCLLTCGVCRTETTYSGQIRRKSFRLKNLYRDGGI